MLDNIPGGGIPGGGMPGGCKVVVGGGGATEQAREPDLTATTGGTAVLLALATDAPGAIETATERLFGIEGTELTGGGTDPVPGKL